MRVCAPLTHTYTPAGEPTLCPPPTGPFSRLQGANHITGHLGPPPSGCPQWRSKAECLRPSCSRCPPQQAGSQAPGHVQRAQGRTSPGYTEHSARASSQHWLHNFPASSTHSTRASFSEAVCSLSAQWDNIHITALSELCHTCEVITETQGNGIHDKRTLSLQPHPADSLQRRES